MSQAEVKVVLITGVTRGLGRALSEQFIALGHTVIGCGRSQARIDTLQRQWAGPHHFSAVDVSHDEQVATWAEQVLAQYDPPDLLINNASLINGNAPLWDVPADEFSQVIDVNIKGPMNVIRHFLPAMREQGHGVIVNLSSGWGRSTAPKVGPYCTTKWAIEGLSRALAQELPPRLAAVALNPGVINTEMLQSCFGSSAEGFPDPQTWSESAAAFLLQLGPEENGQSLSVSLENR